MRAAASLVLAVLCVACAPDVELSVDLVTDYVPRSEFDTVIVAVTPRGSSASTSTRYVVLGGDRFFPTPVRLTAGSVLPGMLDIDVAILREDRIVAGRTIALSVDGTSVIPVYLFRRCQDVRCPGSGDPATATECDDGRCVDPECTDLATCSTPSCSVDGDCPSPAADCAQVVCIARRCAYVEEGGGCPSGRYCDPSIGCITAPPPVAFSFTDVTNALPSVVYDSDEFVAAGFEDPMAAVVTGDASAQLVIGGLESGTRATIFPGNIVGLRMRASTAAAATVEATLTLGDLSASWHVTTLNDTCTMTATMVSFAAPGPAMVVAPAGCRHASFRMWGGGGAGGRNTCRILDGEGGSATTLARASGEELAVAGGGCGGAGVGTGASGAYVEVRVEVSDGEMLLLNVGAGGRTNRVDGPSPGIGPFAGGIGEGGRGFGDFVVLGSPPASGPTLYSYAPFNRTVAFGGRSDTNCTSGPVAGGRGHAELRWGP